MLFFCTLAVAQLDPGIAVLVLILGQLTFGAGDGFQNPVVQVRSPGKGGE